MKSVFVNYQQVLGLENTKYDDGIGDHFAAKAVETRKSVPFGPGHPFVESLYGNANDEVMVVRNSNKNRPLRLAKSNFPDWVLWNVGEEKAAELKVRC